MAIRISGMASGMDTDAMVQDLVKAYKTKGDKNVKTQKRAELKSDKWKDLNKKIKNFTSKYVANMQYSSYYSSKKTTVSDGNKASVVASDGAVTGSQSLEVEELAMTAYLTGGKVGDGITSQSTLKDLVGSDFTDKKIKVNGNEFTISSDTKVSDFVNLVKDAGLNASFDEKNGRFFVSAKTSGASADFNFKQDDGGTDILGAMGLVDTGVDSEGNRLASSAVKIDGSDAKIKLNGATFTNSSNTFSINGLTITAKEKTNGEVNINTETDYDAIYDKVKSFIKDYTSLINEMSELYNAPKNSGYDPLTDEEKEALTDSEVKKWEDKVNESLLRRDTNLGSISSMFRETMLQSYEYNGKSYSLSSFGINTLSYFTASENERYGLHIDGDPDDSETSGNADKLKAAIASDPEAVTNFFTNLTKDLYDKVSKFTRSSTTRSFGSFYDDKKMKSDIETYEKKVSEWDDYVKSIEDRYYKQFSKMESAMTKLNSQQSYISSMFGM